MSKCTIISSEALTDVSHQAKLSERKRKNHNYHPDFADPMNRMLNAFEPGTYVQPHKHENPDKREVFIVLKGKLGVVCFDDDGKITEKHVLAPFPGNPGIEIPERTWHMAIALKEGTVAYELKDGPYLPADDKNFAPWAPSEGKPECRVYLENIISEADF
ncbi:WbuC family cupin fold metalloprotein [Saccharicrinis sp. FJH62]|uniref:WbuC family cupin fold metalloprotein n=1 Tax=Saccharicrinis sp. FJH62 TaxID=3344657 RepID=UPI0035D41397